MHMPYLRMRAYDPEHEMHSAEPWPTGAHAQVSRAPPSVLISITPHAGRGSISKAWQLQPAQHTCASLNAICVHTDRSKFVGMTWVTCQCPWLMNVGAQGVAHTCFVIYGPGAKGF